MRIASQPTPRLHAVRWLLALGGVAGALLLAAPAHASFELVDTFAEGAFSGVGAEEGIGDSAGDIAVDDTTGDIYVADRSHQRVMRLDSHGRFLEAWGWGVGDEKEEYERCGPDGEIAHCEGWYADSGNGRSGEGAGEFKSLAGIAVDQATGEVLVNSGHQHGDIQVFGPEGQLLGSFGEIGSTTPEQIRNGGAIAVSPSGNVYVVDNESQFGGQRIMLFERKGVGKYAYARDALHVSLWVVEAISVDGQEGIYLKGNGGPVGEGVYKFDPGSSTTTPVWEHAAVNSVGAALDSAGHEVFYYDGTADKIRGLEAATGEELEWFRAVKGQESAVGLAFDPSVVWEPGHPPGVLYTTVNYNEKPQFIEAFARPPVFPPRIDSESVVDVGSTSVSFQASVSPQGYETKYRFQYGSEDCATHSCVEVPLGEGDLGSGKEDLVASASVSGLLPETTYHYRVLARNEFGTVEGQDETFTTYPLLSAGLPDGRAYEMVSPAFKFGGEVFPPEISQSCKECTPGETVTPSTMQAAPDGESIVYEGFPFAAAGESVRYNQYLSERTPDGWQTTDLSPPLQSPEGSSYPAFATDLSAGVLAQTQLGAALTSEAPVGYGNLYVESAAKGLRALVSEQPLDRSGHGGNGANAFELSFGGGSSDFGHLIFMANDALTGNSAFAPAAEDGGVSMNNVYEWFDGALRLVNVLPGNTITHAGAVLGSGYELNRGGEGPDYSHAVSADGSRIFWSDRASGQVYVRLDGESTLEIPDSGRFLTASADGSKVLLDDGRVYSLEDGAITDLAEGQGGFQGILGASEDLSRVYFVDTAALPGSGENAGGQSAQTGRDNLYEYDSATATATFVATLLSSDDEVGVSDRTDDWGADPSERRAQVTPDGRFVAFVSSASLTGYDNAGANTGEADLEVFEYDAESRVLVCASCASTGVRPTGGSRLGVIRPGGSAFPPLRSVLEDGRVFFDSYSSLSPYDTNGKIQDVYEYEPASVGTCSRAGGCVFLISKGTGSSDSEFVGAGASGSDVFFMTRDRLVPADQDDLEDVYDARVGGGFPEVTPPQCTGTGCQGVPNAPPIFATPSSVTFAGVGNYEPAAKPKAKPKKKTKAKARKAACAARKRHGRCHEAKSKAKRAGKEGKGR